MKAYSLSGLTPEYSDVKEFRKQVFTEKVLKRLFINFQEGYPQSSGIVSRRPSLMWITLGGYPQSPCRYHIAHVDSLVFFWGRQGGIS
jgi:hypothetical protein